MIAVGRIKSPHGVRGYLKAAPYNSGSLERFAEMGEIEAVKRDGSSLRLSVEDVRRCGAAELLIRFSGYDSPEVARSLSGAELRCDERFAAPKEDGEYYYSELLGCSLADGESTVGRVAAVTEGGGGVLLEIQPDGTSGKSKRFFVPFNGHFIDEVDVSRKTIRMLPERMALLVGGDNESDG